MNKVWQIIKYEYTRHVFRRRFLVSLLSLPVAVIVMIGVAVIIGRFSTDTTPIGYIDPSGTLANPAPRQANNDVFSPTVEFLPYQNREQAQKDLEAGTI